MLLAMLAAQVVFYPSAAYDRGQPTLTIAARNLGKAPVTVCTRAPHCLTLEARPLNGKEWKAWSRSSATAPALGLGDFVTLAPGESRDVFAFPVTRLAKRRFSFGPSFELDPLPARAEVRFTYRAEAGALKLPAPLHTGPTGPGSSPSELFTLDAADVVAGVEAGDPSTSHYVREKDAEVLAALQPVLGKQTDPSKLMIAVQSVAATGLPGAVPSLLAVLQKSDDVQVGSAAAQGVRAMHPREHGAAVLAVLRERAKQGDDSPALGLLIRAVGAMDDPSLLPALREAEATYPPPDAMFGAPWAASVPAAFAVARARLGDAKAVEVLRGAVNRKDEERLTDVFELLPETRSWPVALAVTARFDDARHGTRIKPWVDMPAPRDAKAAKAAADFERDAYVTVGDDAVACVLAMFPDEKWGVTVSPLRVYSKAEKAAVKAIVEKKQR